MSQEDIIAGVGQTTNSGPLSRADRRPARTKQAFFAAMVNIAGTVALDKLTIAALAQAANVNRATFYAHFATLTGVVEQLILALFAAAAAQVPQPLADSQAHGLMGTRLVPYIDALAAHRTFFRWISQSSLKYRLEGLFADAVRGILLERIAQLRPQCAALRLELFVQYTCAGISRVALDWAIQADPGGQKRQELLGILPELWLPAAYAILGIHEESRVG